MLPRWTRLLGFSACAVAGLVACTPESEELGEVVYDAAAQLGHGHAWTPEDDPGEALRARKLDWLQSTEPRMRALALQMTEDLLEAWEIFGTPTPAP